MCRRRDMNPEELSHVSQRTVLRGNITFWAAFKIIYENMVSRFSGISNSKGVSTILRMDWLKKSVRPRCTRETTLANRNPGQTTVRRIGKRV